MITKKTARKILAIYGEIEDCKKALAVLKAKRATPFCSMNVAPNDESEGETVWLHPRIAKEAMEKQLSVLEEEYQNLHDTAARELGV